MNTAQIIAKARGVAKYKIANLSDASALEFLNQIKDEFWSAIVSKIFQEDRNFEEWKTASVAGQQEYTLPPLSGTSDGTKALKTVSIAYSTDTYTNGGLIYRKAKLVNVSSLDYDWDYYVNNQGTGNPIYHVSDNSIFIAPAPNLSTASAIKMTGIRKISDYTLTTVEADIGIPVEYHRVLAFGLAYEMVVDKGVSSEDEQIALNRYENAKNAAVKAMAMRNEWPVTMMYPDEVEDDQYANVPNPCQ